MVQELKEAIKEMNATDVMVVGYFNEDLDAKTCNIL